MKHAVLLSLIIALFSSLTNAETIAAAEEENETPDPLGEFGTIRLLLFEKGPGAPVPGGVVSVGPVYIGTTNEDGSVTIELLEGLYHFMLDIGDDIQREVAIRVMPGEIVEAIAEIDTSSDVVRLALEQSARDAVAAEKHEDGRPVSAIVGQVLNEETGEGIPDARIFVRGEPVEAKTDAEGRFEISVPVGTHDLVVVHSEFGTVTQSGIEVTSDGPAEVTVKTAAVGVELDEFTVTAPRIEGSSVSILQERQQTSQVSDIIGAEQMAKSGDANAAAALKRVTGVTIVGGKYVYVRGLGERYSATMLNRLNLPSPDPERRVVPLDMFPAAILESMVIQKSFSPDMPGEFGGGVVDLRTKGYSDETLFNLSLSGSVDTGSTFSNTEFSSDKGSLDFLGFDNGHRALDELVKKATNGRALEKKDRFSDGYEPEELVVFSRAMRKNYGLTTRRIPPDLKIEVTGGKGFKIKKTKFGFLSSVLYKNDWDMRSKIVRDYKIGDAETETLEVKNRYNFDETENTVTLGGILALGVDFEPGQSIKANTIVNRITDNEFWVYEGFSLDSDKNIRALNYEWIERMIFTQQVLGEHLIVPPLGVKLNWRYAFSNARRNEPDQRMTRYDLQEDGVWKVSGDPSGNRRSYLSVDDDAHDMGLDFSLPFKQWTKEEGLVKAGGSILLKKREVDVRRFMYKNIGNLEVDTRAVDLDDFYIDENMTVDGMRLIETTKENDNYSGEQEVFAGYLMTELPLGLGFKTTGGLRIEQSTQVVETYQLFSDKNRIESKIDKLDFLPAVSLIYEFGPNMLVRLGYGKTVNRPDFSEMSPGCAPSYAGGYDLCGAWESEDFENKLKRAVIHNVDLRWEWYPKEGESISFGGFYKEFIDPLELVVGSGADKLMFIMNVNGARNFGLEFDVRKDFEFITEKLRDVYVAGNATWVWSRVELPDLTTMVLTNKKRALQGQSPYIFNFQLGYDNVDIGTSAVVLYNVFGKRISGVGTVGLPDIYEQPFHQLDVVLKQKIKKHFEVGFKAQNLLNWDVASLQGGEITKKYKKGRSFTLSASFKY